MKRTAKYYLEISNLHIHTNFSLMENSDDESNRAIFKGLEEIPGVERISLARYHTDISFGFLFNTQEVADKVLDLLIEMFNIDVLEEFSAADLLEKSKELPSRKVEEENKQTASALAALEVFGGTGPQEA